MLKSLLLKHIFSLHILKHCGSVKLLIADFTYNVISYVIDSKNNYYYIEYR